MVSLGHQTPQTYIRHAPFKHWTCPLPWTNARARPPTPFFPSRVSRRPQRLSPFATPASRAERTCLSARVPSVSNGKALAELEQVCWRAIIRPTPTRSLRDATSTERSLSVEFFAFLLLLLAPPNIPSRETLFSCEYLGQQMYRSIQTSPTHLFVSFFVHLRHKHSSDSCSHVQQGATHSHSARCTPRVAFLSLPLARSAPFPRGSVGICRENTEIYIKERRDEESVCSTKHQQGAGHTAEGKWMMVGLSAGVARRTSQPRATLAQEPPHRVHHEFAPSRSPLSLSTEPSRARRKRKARYGGSRSRVLRPFDQPRYTRSSFFQHPLVTKNRCTRDGTNLFIHFGRASLADYYFFFFVIFSLFTLLSRDRPTLEPETVLRRRENPRDRFVFGTDLKTVEIDDRVRAKWINVTNIRRKCVSVDESSGDIFPSKNLSFSLFLLPLLLLLLSLVFFNRCSVSFWIRA